ncbi:MAG: glycosyl hydrolase [Oscillospiraceae bacterium]|nr:glycosyl hydrolase [Oscillospiraceae bacterium]
MKHNKKWFAASLAATMAVNAVCLSSLFSGSAADVVKYEFEDGTITGATTAVEEAAGASGGKIVHLKDAGDTLTIKVNVEKAGMYDMNVCYATDGGAKTQKMNINGTPQSDIAFSNQSAFKESKVATVKLEAGENTIEIVSYWGWTQFDYMTLTEPVYPELTASSVLSDKSATAETQSLMNYLASVYGKHVISGQQEIYMYGPHDFEYEFNYIQEKTGELPAIRGFDFLNSANVLYGSEDGTVDRMINWAKDKNGIVTASWHVTVPKNFANYTLGSKINYDDATYAVWSDNAKTVPATDFDTSKVLEEGTKEREYYMLCLKALAEQIQKLQDANVPLILRPLHEAEGGGGEDGSWFWWGQDGSAVYKELWKLTYKTLTEDYGLHNLIWEWNSYTYDTSTDWYPGDEYVDLVAYDKYNCTDWSTGSAVLVHNDSAIGGTFYSLVEQYGGKKMVAMAENDSIPTLENFQMEKAGWLYFCPWYDGGSYDTNFLSNELFNKVEDLKTIYQSDYCITLDELPEDLYGNGGTVITTTTKEGQTTTSTTKTTTVTTTTTKVPDAIMADIKKDDANFKLSFSQAMGDKVYLVLELDKDVTYANGCLGVSVTIDGTDYWVSYKWEATKSGETIVDLSGEPFNVILSSSNKEVTDSDVIAKVVEAAQEQKSAEVQTWWANDGAGESVDTTKVTLTAAYIPDNGGSATTTTVTTVDTEETTTTPETTTTEDTAETTTTTNGGGVTSYGDVNLDGKVDLTDAITINKYMAKAIAEFTPAQLANANCDISDGTNNVNEADATALTNFVIMLEEKLPVNHSTTN